MIGNLQIAKCLGIAALFFGVKSLVSCSSEADAAPLDSGATKDGGAPAEDWEAFYAELEGVDFDDRLRNIGTYCSSWSPAERGGNSFRSRAAQGVQRSRKSRRSAS